MGPAPSPESDGPASSRTSDGPSSSTKSASTKSAGEDRAPAAERAAPPPPPQDTFTRGGSGGSYGGQVDRFGRWTGAGPDPRNQRPPTTTTPGMQAPQLGLPPSQRPPVQIRPPQRPVDTIENTDPNRNVPPGIGVMLPPSSLPGAAFSFGYAIWETIRPRRPR